MSHHPVRGKGLEVGKNVVFPNLGLVVLLTQEEICPFPVQVPAVVLRVPLTATELRPLMAARICAVWAA